LIHNAILTKTVQVVVVKPMKTDKEKLLLENNGLVLSLDKDGEFDFWEMWIKGEQYPIGFFRVDSDGTFCRANISGCEIYVEADRNKGYGSRYVQMLANHYGVISSASNGSSNEQAFGMWRKAKAEKKEIQTQYTDHIYVLYKNDR